MAAKKESTTTEKFKVSGRLSFPRLDKPKSFEEGQDPRWESTFLLDPASKEGLESIKLVIKQAATLGKTAYGFVPLELRKLAAQFVPGQAAPDPKSKDDGVEVAFYAGDRKEYDGYEGMFVVPSHNAKLKPAVANRRGVSVEPGDDQYPYAGCYVLGSLTLWAMDNKYGKRILVNLRGVQFMKDGEAFSQGDIAAEDEFEALEDAAAAGDVESDDLGM